MTSGDPLLDLERKNVILRLTDGEEIRGRLVSVRGDLLTVAVEVPRRRWWSYMWPSPRTRPKSL